MPLPLAARRLALRHDAQWHELHSDWSVGDSATGVDQAVHRVKQIENIPTLEGA